MGLEELTNIRNVERLKKELRVRLWDVSAVRSLNHACWSGTLIPRPRTSWGTWCSTLGLALLGPRFTLFPCQASYSLIDSFLGNAELIGDLTQCVDCAIPPEGSLMQVLGRLQTCLRGSGQHPAPSYHSGV